MRFQNTKMGIKSSSGTNRDEFKNIMLELRNNQIQKRESDKKSKNKNSQLIEDNSKQKQFEQNQKLVIKECVDKPEKQARQKSALSQDYPESKKRSERISSKQSTLDIQKQFNEKLLQQLERLIQMKKIDSKFFFGLVKRHIEECPQFGKRVKEEIKVLLNQLL
ncbi:unnamed protein product [Paramecium octaurelia]|nr:unnamed protein product [Paramecium octaurelia]